MRGSIRVADVGVDTDGSGDGQYPSTGSQPHNADQYDVSLIVPGSGPTQAPLIVNNLPVICAELVLQQGFHALVGRDILAQCLLEYNGATGLTGLFTLAY